MYQRMSFIIIMCLVVTLGSCASGGDSTTGERFSGRVASLGGGPIRGQTALMELHVWRYGSDELVQDLAATLAEEGEKALHKAVFDIEPMGWIRFGNNTRYHLRVIRSIDTAEGRIIRALTDRPLAFAEMKEGTRSRRYAYGIIELQLDENDQGSGSLIAAARISFSNNRIEFESFGTQPVKVLSVAPQDL